MGSNATLQLNPNGLYVLVSTARSDYPAAITEDTIEESFAKGDQFEWGLYWSKAHGVGESRRYRERKGIWELQTTLYPSANRTSLLAIEDDARIIVAIQVADMDKAMLDRLNEDLKPKFFPHSQPARAQAARSPSQQRSTKLTGAFIEPDDGRSRKWLGHALFMMLNRGYITLEDDAASISMLEKGAVKAARKNLAAAERSVEACDHIMIQGPAAVFRFRVLEGFLEEESEAPAQATEENEEVTNK